MTKDEDFKLLKIQTCVLRVNIHCDGCKQKVKKLLHRIEGVYQVNIEAEQQKVTVSGERDSATLIKKLVRAGKHAELWSQKSNQNQKQKANCIKEDKNDNGQKHALVKGLEALKNQQKFPINLEEDEDFLDDDDGEEYDDEEGMMFLREKANQINMLRQQGAAMQGNNANNGLGQAMASAAAAASNNSKMNNNAAKKGNHTNQNMGMKANPGGIDPRTLAALKMQNVQFAGAANLNPGGGKMGNDINSMMNLAGFHGNNGPNNFASTGSGGGGIYHQIQPNNHGFMGSSSAGFPAGGMTTGHHPSAMMMNTNGGHQQQHNHPSSSSMLMNLQNKHAMQQPQMMYNRSPYIPTSTGYYYTYGPPIPPYGYYMSTELSYNSNADNSETTHMFNDENTSSCSIM
ncbi:hypothetical protein ACH5RR_036305 [Cinchona calisaya]|uniref:HMA domain-containing protein n=1 Tax=Cinchona calisaya TaxID=153742 RepID=A0ABD2Y4A1_9GENT